MKKTLILMAAAASVVLTGCTESDLSSDTSLAKESAPSAIEFSAKTRSAGSTRAGAVNQINTTSLQTGGHKDAGFAVFAFNTGTSDWSTVNTTAKPNFMYNQQVKWDTSVEPDAWTYSPVKYWPNGDDAANAANSPSNTATEANAQKLSFFAYAPYVPVTASSGAPTTTLGTPDYGITALTGNDVAGHPIITYSLKYVAEPASYDLSAANNVDLLWGVKGANSYSEASETDGIQTLTGDYNTDLTKFNTTDRIKFNLKHALSKYGGYDNSKAFLKVVADIDGNSATPETSGFGTDLPDNTTLITLQNITIKPKTATTDANKIIMNGQFDITTGVWKRLSSGEIVAPTTHNLVSTTNSASGINEQVWEPTTAPTYSSGWKKGETAITGVKSGTPKDVYTSVETGNGAGAFYFIPFTQNSDASAFTYNPQIEVTVTYIVRTYDDHLAATASGGEGTWSKVTQTITNYVTLPTPATNKVYTLVMHLGLTSVKFSAEVADWEGDSETDAERNIEVVWLPSNVVQTTVNATEVTAAAGSTNVALTELAGSTLTVVAVDGTVVANTTDVTNLDITSGSATVTIAYTVNSSTTDGRTGWVKLSDGTKTITVNIPQAKAGA